MLFQMILQLELKQSLSSSGTVIKPERQNEIIPYFNNTQYIKEYKCRQVIKRTRFL